MENKNHTFTKVNNELLLRSTKLTDADKLTLALILSWIENDKECFMSNDYIGDMLGISTKAASKRILRLKRIGCIQLYYTYKEGKKQNDKRYITFLSYEPKVSPDSLQVSPDSLQGISSEEIGYVPTDDGVSPDRIGEVSPKGGGIIQPFLLDDLLKNGLHNGLNNGANNEISGWERYSKLKEQIKLDFSQYFKTEHEQHTFLFKWVEQSAYKNIVQKIGRPLTPEEIKLFETYVDSKP